MGCKRMGEQTSRYECTNQTVGPRDALIIMKSFACSSKWIREEWSALCVSSSKYRKEGWKNIETGLTATGTTNFTRRFSYNKQPTSCSRSWENSLLPSRRKGGEVRAVTGMKDRGAILASLRHLRPSWAMRFPQRVLASRLDSHNPICRSRSTL